MLPVIKYRLDLDQNRVPINISKNIFRVYGFIISKQPKISSSLLYHSIPLGFLVVANTFLKWLSESFGRERPMKQTMSFFYCYHHIKNRKYSGSSRLNFWTLFRIQEVWISEETNFTKTGSLINGDILKWWKSELFVRHENKIKKLNSSDLPEIQFLEWFVRVKLIFAISY